MTQTVANAAAVSVANVTGGIPTDLFRRDVSSWMKKTRRTDTPFLMMISKGEPFSDPYIKTEWGMSHPFPMEDTITTAIGDTGATTNIEFANPAYFQIGDVIQIDNEQMRLTARGSGNTFDVTRAFAGTTGATHVDNAVVIIISPAMNENDDTPLSPHKQGDLEYNIAQQIELSNQISHRGKIIKSYESLAFGGDRFKKMASDLLNERAPLGMERILMFGQRYAGDYATDKPGTMGGITYSSYTANRNVSLSGPLTEQTLMDNMQTVYNAVGQEKMGKTLVAHPTVIRIISGWYKSIRRITADAKKLSIHVAEIDTMFGTIKLVPHYNWRKPSGTAHGPHPGLMLANFKDFNLRPLHSSTRWQLDYVAQPYTNGWYEKCFVRGDYTLTAEEPYSRLYLEGFSVDLGDYPGTP